MNSYEYIDHTYDVVVVGAGGSGLRATLGMAEQVNIDMPSDEEITNCVWLTDKELKYYVNVFNNTQFQGGLNWYRCMIDNKVQANLRIYSNIQI